MRVALLNTYASGGAATATRRISRGLDQIGVETRLITRGNERTEGRPQSTWRRWYAEGAMRLDYAPLKLYDVTQSFSVGWMADRISPQIEEFDPDILHLNWIPAGFLNMRTLREVDRPLVWRLPDMWALTGGCHFSGECRRFEGKCGRCPALSSDSEPDLSTLVWKLKERTYPNLDLHIVAPSTWLATQARRSSLLSEKPIRVIPNGLNTRIFSPRQITGAGEKDDRLTILFGAIDAVGDDRKGADLLFEALEILDEDFGRDQSSL